MVRLAGILGGMSSAEDKVRTSGCCEFAAAYSAPTYRGLLPFSA
jgi:hypothetical protein